MSAPGAVENPRNRVIRGYCYPVPLGPSEAAALLLHISLLRDARLLSDDSANQIVDLLNLRDAANWDQI